MENPTPAAPSKSPRFSPSACQGLPRSCIRSSGSGCWCSFPAPTSTRPPSSLPPSWRAWASATCRAGWWRTACPAATALTGFAAAELAIALFSLVSRPLYYDVLYQQLGSQSVRRRWLGAVLFISLLWPTFFMGVSLPLLARRRSLPRSARHAARVGRLYAVNTLGAAAGAFVTTWVILPAVGLDQGLRIGAAMNALCVALILPFLAGRGATWTQATLGPGTMRAPHWTRACRLSPGSSFMQFPGLSRCHSKSCGSGSWASWRRRQPSPSAPCWRSTCLASPSAHGSAASRAATTASRLYGFAPARAPSGCWADCWSPRLSLAAIDLYGCGRYFGSYEALDRPGRARQAAARADACGVPVCSTSGFPPRLLLPPTFLMGFCFPILQRIVQTDFARLGRRLGSLMVANIAGSVLGTVATGVIALDVLGTAGTLKALALVSILFAFATLGSVARGRVRFAILLTAALLFAGVWRALPDATALWARLHGAAADRMHRGRGRDGSVGDPARARRATGAVDSLRQRRRSEHNPLRQHPYRARNVARVSSSSASRRRHHRAWLRRHGLWRRGPARHREYHLRGDHRATTERAAPTGAVANPTAASPGCSSDPRIEHVTGDGRIFLMRSRRNVRHHRSRRLAADERLLRQSLLRGIFHIGDAAACGLVGWRPPGCPPSACTTHSFVCSPTS